MTRRQSGLSYMPALDGVRAVAVVAVLLYHGQVDWQRGGFIGVDLFFVLSGFLITSLLLSEWEATGRIDLKAFWLRRARRLFPALVLVLFAVSAYAALWIDPSRRSAIRGDMLATIFYFANWRYALGEESYFAQFGEPSPLRHTWSLAIEEQYYLLFPVLMLAALAWARLHPRALAPLLLALAAASVVTMAVLYDPSMDPSRVYYGTDTHAHGLLLGAWGALVTIGISRPGWRFRVGRRVVHIPGWRLLGLAGIAGVAVMTVTSRDLAPWMYRGGFLLAGVFALALVVGVAKDSQGLVARLLSQRPLVLVGMVSYGLYLWHWPVYALLSPDRTGVEGTGLLILRIAATAMVAVASFVLVEKPIRTRALQRRLARAEWRMVAVATPAAAIVVALVATSGATSPGPLADGAPVVPGQGAEIGVNDRLDADTVESDAPVPAGSASAIGPARVFILGDSQAYGLITYAAGRTSLSVVGSTQLGCGTLLPERVVNGQVRANIPACREWEPRWTREVGDAGADVYILMLGIGELFDRTVEGRTLTFGSPEHSAWLRSEIDRRVEVLGSAGGTVALTTVPCNRVLDSGTSADASITNDPQRLDQLNAQIREYALENDVALIDLYAFVCPNGYEETKDGVMLRSDGLHFSEDGTTLVWRWLEAQIASLGGPSPGSAATSPSSGSPVRDTPNT